MKLTKSRLKKIIKEELGKVMEQEESLKVPGGDAGQQFVDAISKIQGVLRKYEMDEYTLGTYDPEEVGNAAAAWNRYDKQWELAVADKTFKEARASLLGLMVVKDSEKLRIGDVNIPKGEYEANSDAYIMLVDPQNPTYKNRKPRPADSIMISDDYVVIDDIISVESPQGTAQ